MIKYTSHNWELCGDFKMLAFLLGQQGEYTKCSCYLCLWNSRADDQHYSRKQWPLRRINSWCTQCYSPTSSSERKCFLPTLHIKLGLAKQFVKALKSDSEAFKHVQAMFPKSFRSKGERWYIHRTTDLTNAWLQGIRSQNDCFRKRCLAVILLCCA